MKITLSPAAREYVTREARYLKSVSPKAAQRFGEEFRQLRHSLARFPGIGKANEELPVPGVRRFVMEPYLVDYEIMADEIRILTVRHGRERPPAVDLDDDYNFEA